MAKIFLSAMSNCAWTQVRYHDFFIDGFLRALKRSGNTILAARCNEFQDKRRLQKAELISDIKKFSPDIIITFNNHFPHPDLIDEAECPILCFASDL